MKTIQKLGQQQSSQQNDLRIDYGDDNISADSTKSRKIQIKAKGHSSGSLQNFKLQKIAQKKLFEPLSPYQIGSQSFHNVFSQNDVQQGQIFEQNQQQKVQPENINQFTISKNPRQQQIIIHNALTLNQNVKRDLNINIILFPDQKNEIEIMEKPQSQKFAVMVRQPSNLVQIPIALEFTESNKKEVCSICLGEFSEKSKKYSLKQCNHTYHVSCIKLYFKMKIKDRCVPLQCPETQCIKEPQIEDFKIVGKIFVEKYYQYTLNVYVSQNPNSVAYCPTPNCQYVFAFGEDDFFFECLLCKKHFCIFCRVEYHMGQTCEQYRHSNQNKNQKLFYLYLKGHGAKKCPQCQIWVQKVEGCDHMTCRCKNQFCYVCGGQYKKCSCVNPTQPPNLQYYNIPESEQIQLPLAAKIQHCQPIINVKQTRFSLKKLCCCFFP